MVAHRHRRVVRRLCVASGDDKSLAVKFVNWAVDPRSELPILPDQLALGLGDDPDAVDDRDLQVQQYDALYLKGGWTRKRLELKVARDPFNPIDRAAVARRRLRVLTAFVSLADGRARKDG